MSRAALLPWAAAFLLSCAPALREPPAVETGVLPPGSPPPGPDQVDRLLAEGEADFARRPDPAAVGAAQRAFVEAARADPTRVEGLLGTARVSAWMADHESSAARRQERVATTLRAGQWCARRAPAEPSCDYWLAIGLGLQARERAATAHDGLARMVELLSRAAEKAPRLDEAGPHRVLALVFLRAPRWPLGPGDDERGLAEAEQAVHLYPDYVPNQLALAEALHKNGRRPEAQVLYRRAQEAAEVLVTAGHADAPSWREEAATALSAVP